MKIFKFLDNHHKIWDTVESPKTDTPRSDSPLKRTNLVPRIEFAKHVIPKHSPRSEQFRIPDNGQGNSPEWGILIQDSPKSGQPETAPKNFHWFHKIYIIIWVAYKSTVSQVFQQFFHLVNVNFGSIKEVHTWDF